MRPRLLVTVIAATAAVALGGVLLVSRATDGPQASSPGATSSVTPAPASPAETPSEGSQGADEPVDLEYEFPVADCPVSYARTHHDYPAADIFADRGCSFVAPVAGRVDEVVDEDAWDPATNRGAARGGRSVSVVGEDGVRYYGSHLAAVAPGIRPGVEVEAGQTLGQVGDSGSARGTGTHLHFGISWPTPPGRWWIRRGAVAPQPYLDAWQKGRDRSPVERVEQARRRYGDDSACRDYC